MGYPHAKELESIMNAALLINANNMRQKFCSIDSRHTPLFPTALPIRSPLLNKRIQVFSRDSIGIAEFDGRQLLCADVVANRIFA